MSTSQQYLHEFEEFLNGLRVIRELLHQVGFHLSFPREDGVLPFLITQANLNGVKMLIQLLELQLALRELVKADTQQTILMDLTNVVKPWRRKSGKHEHGVYSSRF